MKLLVSAYEVFLDGMTDSYMSWRSSRGERGWESIAAENPADVDNASFVELTVVDIFCMYRYFAQRRAKL